MAVPGASSWTIERRGAIGFELIRGTLSLELDGVRAATLARRGDVVTLAVRPGEHRLQARIGRFHSHVLELPAFDGGEVHFRTHGAMLWPRWLIAQFRPGLGVALHRVTQDAVPGSRSATARPPGIR